MNEISNFAAVLKSKLREQMNLLADTIVTGRLSQEEYRLLCGQIEGLAMAEREMLDLMRTAASEDNAD
jgi:hypothetical protein